MWKIIKNVAWGLLIVGVLVIITSVSPDKVTQFLSGSNAMADPVAVEIIKPVCEYSELSQDNILKMVNVLRVEKGKSSLERASSLDTLAKNTLDSGATDKVIDEWRNTNRETVQIMKSIGQVTAEGKNVCEMRDSLKDNSSLLDVKYNKTGIGISSNKAYIFLVESKSSSEISTQNKRAYIQGEIDKLLQSRQMYLDAVIQANKALDTCPQGFYDSCSSRIKQSTDQFYQKISQIDSEIQEWKRKLADSM